MEIAEAPLAREIVINNLGEEGPGISVAGRLREVARDLRSVRESTRDDVVDVMPGQVESDALPDSLVQYVDVTAVPEDFDWQVTEEIVQATAEDIQSIVGSNEVTTLDAGVAGQALQGVGGSSQIDVSSAVQEGTPGTSVIDTTQLSDVVKHEKKHEVQAANWNADSVEVVVDEVGHTVVLTRHAISETDAMLVQSTIANVSYDYRHIHQETTGFLTDVQISETAQTGDLVGLKEKIEASTQNPDLVLAA